MSAHASRSRPFAVVVQFLEQRHQLNRGAAVERAGRLIGKQHFRIVDQCARHGHALLLAAGQCVTMMDAFAQADPLQSADRLLSAARAIGLA